MNNSILCDIKSFSSALKDEKWLGGQCPKDWEFGQNPDQTLFSNNVALVKIPIGLRRYY